MKKALLPFCLAILLSCGSLVAQTQLGKKATLNEDGTLEVETVQLPAHLSNPTNKQQANELFQFGRPTNPIVKNTRGVTLADLDDDGIDEILYGIDTTLFALKGDGTILWEKTVLGPILLPPTVADLDEDGTPEIIVNTGYPTTVGRIYLMDNTGADLAGWPLNFNDNWMINAPVVADVDDNGTLDIITCERAGSAEGYVHVLNLDGTPINSNWPVQTDATPAFTPSIGDMDNDGNTDVVIATSSTGMRIYDNQGQLFPNFPLVDPNVKYSYQSPILADLDGDDDLEIIGSNHGDAPGFYVLNHDATYYPGWPVPLDGWTYSPATVVDLDSDDVFEIFMSDRATSGDSTPLDVIYGLTPDGNDLNNFPIAKYGGTEGVLSIADINNDGVFEIIFPSVLTDANGDGYIHAYSTDGSGEIDGFPLRPRGFTFLNGAVIGDVDNDGMMDLTANSYTQTFGQGVDSTFVTTYNLNVPYEENKIIRNGYKGKNTRQGLVVPEIITGIEEFSKASINLTPNPSNGILNLNLSIALENATVTLYTIDGKQVFSEERNIVENETIAYNFKSLASGLYLVNISNGKKTYTAKWVKK
ncbi:T9SS type A sorting domain-containing protein [Marixanthomonas spongiae]|uniref:Secretion system C-terminal sorting domain-containing protein n=1 Tax=Marixanthomonas spongiae TaxID=2174845 RepID=A0A2U0I7A4_9FLAO|nr:T9SS type A sorting domain-containing protein [Marixanthomonas spongiae]PVW16978.1 hypothetical protein DDV96_00160 [Marixanthomonas spongiae]